MAEINQHNRTIGIKEGVTWGTGLQVDSKLSVETFGPQAQREIKRTTNHDRGFNPGIVKQGRETADFAATGQASFGEGWLLLYALFAGTATGSPAEVNVGQGDYLHNIDMANASNKFFCCAWENESDTVHEFKSVVPISFSFQFQENEAVQWQAQGIAHSKAVTSSTSNAQLNALADVMTVPDEMALLSGTNMYVRLGDYSTGTSLSSTHDMCMASASIQLSRPKTRRFCTDGANTRYSKQPFQTGMNAGQFQIVLAEQDDATIDLYTKYVNGTPMMAEIFVDGSQIGSGANTSLKFQLPYLVPQTDPGSDGVTSQAGHSTPTLTFDMASVATAPAGMTGVTDMLMRLVSVDERSTAYTS